MGQSNTTSPSISQAAKLIFQNNFYKLAQQTKSRLVAAKAINFLPTGGKTNEMARMGRLELVEVTTRNPGKQFSDYAVDNRQFTKRRFTRTIQIDAKQDINELVTDPTSDIIFQLNSAKERMIDRIAIQAAVGSVLVGGPDVAPSSITAAQDGVVTVDATAGMVYETVQQLTENFINSDLEDDEYAGSVLAITGKEHASLMGEIEFINNFYINGKPVDNGVMDNAGTYQIRKFAGSSSGGGTLPNPILPEISTTRQCVCLAPNSISMAMEVALMDVTRSADRVNSWDVTVDLWLNAMRNEGVKIQIINTTI